MSAPMEELLADVRDPEIARGLVRAIDELAPRDRTVTLMEVCGTHTMSIAKNAIRDLMPPTVRLSSGPGCPVCVTANADIDRAIALSRLPNVTIATFGDMVRVPGSDSSLLAEQANGADVRVVYSPLDALDIARHEPDREVVLLAVGFETTTPITAATLRRARAEGLANLSALSMHKSMPGALDAIANDPECRIDAFILPGHVSTITGTEMYRFLADDHGIPGVIAGFEANDILQAIAMILRQLHDGTCQIQTAYTRCVMEDGNPVARAAIDEVFHPCDAAWRGLGVIPGSGYALREEFANMDATKRFDVEVVPTKEHAGCRCGDVLRGTISPEECALFGRVCTPEQPIGPCMVSSEGACAAHFRYR